MDHPEQTSGQLAMVLDQITMLRHLMFGSISTDLLYSVASKLPALETLCATAVYDGNTKEHPSVLLYCTSVPCHFVAAASASAL